MLKRDPRRRPTIEQILDKSCCRHYANEPHQLFDIPAAQLAVTPLTRKQGPLTSNWSTKINRRLSFKTTDSTEISDTPDTADMFRFETGSVELDSSQLDPTTNLNVLLEGELGEESKGGVEQEAVVSIKPINLSSVFSDT